MATLTGVQVSKICFVHVLRDVEVFLLFSGGLERLLGCFGNLFWESFGYFDGGPGQQNSFCSRLQRCRSVFVVFGWSLEWLLGCFWNHFGGLGVGFLERTIVVDAICTSHN